MSEQMTIEMFRKIKNCVPFADAEAGLTETMNAMDWADARIAELTRERDAATRRPRRDGAEQSTERKRPCLMMPMEDFSLKGKPFGCPWFSSAFRRTERSATPPRR